MRPLWLSLAVDTEMAEFHYQCTECGRSFERDEVRYLCPVCGEKSQPGMPLRGVLEAHFHWDKIRPKLNLRTPDWELFCAVEAEYHPPFPVGNTPLVRVPRLDAQFGRRLLLKNDGLNPSGSLKDRASELMVAEAIRLKEERVVTASTGNAAAALAAACAAAGKQAIIFAPARAPRAKLAQMLLYGATVYRVDGTYDDAFRLSLEYTRARGGLNRNTAYHPLTIEGKKTVALEVFAQNGYRMPDAVVVPVGDGVILAGAHKGFRDLCEAGLAERVPRLIGVQAVTSDAIHHFVTTGEYRGAMAPTTIADSISVRAPSNAYWARRAIEESDGFTLTVTDEEIRAGQRTLARFTGIFAEPAAAAVVAAVERIRPEQLAPETNIVLLISGHGLKDVDAALNGVELPPPIEPRLEVVV
jgi:threonine synthase